MNYSSDATPDISALIDGNLHSLSSISTIIEQLPADHYNRVESPLFESSLGKHVRHILDHYLSFMRDIESDTIDYDQRLRDNQLEVDKGHALGVIKEIQAALLRLNSTKERQLRVVLCHDVATPQGEATRSSISRELQFLQSHTVHHCALIAVMLRFYGAEVNREFGIAPSTLVHESTVKASA